MRIRTLWKCDGCGREQELRAIDSHRWVTTAVDPNGEQLDKTRVLQLCPSCQVRLMVQQDLDLSRIVERA